MQLAQLDRPLLPADRQRLAAFLATRAVAQGGMDPETLDGFFTSLVICPEPVVPALFLDPALGLQAGDPFASKAEAELWVSLVMRHWNGLAHGLLAGRPLRPWLLPGKAQGRAWARGFLRGMAVFPARWEALRQKDAGLLLPFLRLAEREDAPEPLSDGDRKALVQELPEAVKAVLKAFQA